MFFSYNFMQIDFNGKCCSFTVFTFEGKCKNFELSQPSQRDWE